MYSSMRNELTILDTKLGFEKSSIAIIRLPMEVRIGFLFTYDFRTRLRNEENKQGIIRNIE